MLQIKRNISLGQVHNIKLISMIDLFQKKTWQKKYKKQKYVCEKKGGKLYIDVNFSGSLRLFLDQAQ